MFGFSKMGGEYSSGQTNDELIDNLLKAGHIKSPLITKVFKSVDRGEYFLPEARVLAYQNRAWRNGNLHISAPCIYAQVMEGLCLVSGLSFLNLGSGTGYLSTMVGLILGTKGTNHGVEIYEDVVQYANKKLNDFKTNSRATREYNFCEPTFIKGNCLRLAKDTNRYDRIYCAAACPEQYKTYMENLLTIGGVLIIPIKDRLLQIKRLSETRWESKILIGVSFATLIMPPDNCQDWVNLNNIAPNMSSGVPPRPVFRHIFVKNIKKDNSDVERIRSYNIAPNVPLGIPPRPVFQNISVKNIETDNPDLERIRPFHPVSRTPQDQHLCSISPVNIINTSFCQESQIRLGQINEDTRTTEKAIGSVTMVTADTSQNSSSSASTSHQVYAVIQDNQNLEINNESNENLDDEYLLDTINEISSVIVKCLGVLKRVRENMEMEEENN